MSDRRLTPANGRVAALALRGAVVAERFVEGDIAAVLPPAAWLCAAPEGARDRQLLHGEAVTVYERRAGWAFVQAAKDGYCGYLDEGALGPAVSATHRVDVRQSHLYPRPDMKRPPLMWLPFGAAVEVVESDGRWARLPDGGAVPVGHLRPVEARRDDPVAVAEIFLGTPYLWAGNTGTGIDCSGLVQAALLACGVACPGDSDLQQALGEGIEEDAPLQRGDLLFWKGHVAMATDPGTMIHANAHHMAVVHEGIPAAIARIIAQGDGPVTARRRVSLPSG